MLCLFYLQFSAFILSSPVYMFHYLFATQVPILVYYTFIRHPWFLPVSLLRCFRLPLSSPLFPNPSDRFPLRSVHCYSFPSLPLTRFSPLRLRWQEVLGLYFRNVGARSALPLVHNLGCSVVV
jgi:hypothetical protein